MASLMFLVVDLSETFVLWAEIEVLLIELKENEVFILWKLVTLDTRPQLYKTIF